MVAYSSFALHDIAESFIRSSVAAFMATCIYIHSESIIELLSLYDLLTKASMQPMLTYSVLRLLLKLVVRTPKSIETVG
jgi:hypothetical protein